MADFSLQTLMMKTLMSLPSPILRALSGREPPERLVYDETEAVPIDRQPPAECGRAPGSGFSRKNNFKLKVSQLTSASDCTAFGFR